MRCVGGKNCSHRTIWPIAPSGGAATKPDFGVDLRVVGPSDQQALVNFEGRIDLTPFDVSLGANKDRVKGHVSSPTLRAGFIILNCPTRKRGHYCYFYYL